MATKKSASGRAFAFGAGAGQLDGAPECRARGQAARDIDRGAAMLEGQRFDDPRLVGPEVVVVDGRAAGLQVGGDVARQGAFVVLARAAVAHPLIGLAEVAELEIARRALPVVGRNATAVGQVVGLRRGKLGEMLRPVGDHHLHVPVELHAALGKLQGRRHHVLPFQACRSVPAPWPCRRPVRARRSSDNRPRSSARGCRARRRDWRGRGRRWDNSWDRASWPRADRSRSSRHDLPWRSRSS